VRERGAASLELALGVTLLLIPAVIAVLAFAPWLESRQFVRSAAAEAARAVVVAEGDPSSAGSVVVAELASARGYEAGSVEVVLCGSPPVRAGEMAAGCRLARDELVIVTVSTGVPLVRTPWGEVGSVTVEATHAEPVDAYRSLP
jgi:hypothetical protein